MSAPTLRSALAAAVQRLKTAETPDPARDARLLLAHAAGLAPDRLTLHLDDPLTDPARFEELLDARIRRQPVSQIIGKRLFWGRWFTVTSDVLDPRPETEILIATALQDPFERVLDLGTGTGAIVLTLLAERPAARGLGTDLSSAALAVATANAVALGLAERVELCQSDWFEVVEGMFDLIVSNPPYIPEGEIATLAPETRDWEPRMALTPGGDGLDAYRRIAANAGAHLSPGGRLIVEFGAGQGAAVACLLTQAGFAQVRLIPDMDGRDRVASALWAQVSAR